jgi:hypothetical protein
VIKKQSPPALKEHLKKPVAVKTIPISKVSSKKEMKDADNNDYETFRAV